MSRRRHDFVPDTPTTAVCVRGCTSRNRHATDCQAGHVDDCGGCQPKEAAPGSVLCRGCIQRLTRNIAELPALYDDLENALRRYRSSMVMGPQGGEQPTFVAGPVVALRDQIRHDLAWWVMHVRDDRGLAGTPADNINAMACWLTVHVEWCAQQPWADEMYAVFAELRGRSYGLADIPRDKAQFTVGPCPERDDDDVPCPGQVWAYVPQSDDEPVFVACGACEKSWPEATWRRLGRRMDPERARNDRWLVRIPDAARATGVPERTIRRWVRNGRICDHSRTMTAVVDVAEVEQLRDTRDGRLAHQGIMADSEA